MAQLGIPINGHTYDANTAGRWIYGRTNGIFSSDTDLIVTPGGGMNVNISTGAAWMTPSKFLGICYTNDAVEVLTHQLAGNTLPRIDRIVVHWNVTEVGTHPYLMIKKGTESSNPVAPSIDRTASSWELAIMDVRIPAGTLVITQAMLTGDRRLDQNLCGIVESGIKSIPTQNLYDSWWAWFSELQTSAEEKVAILTEWITTFKNENIDGLEEWLTTFKDTSLANMNNWFNSNTSSFEAQFNSWFSDLQNTLDENQATNLFNRIDQHERLTLTVDTVHGMRLNEGRFQIFDGIGWLTLARVQQGLTAAYADEKQMTALEFDLLQLTANQFDNLVERRNE